MTINWRQLHGSHFTRQRVLITGGAGFIGSHLAEALDALGASVIVLDDLCGGDQRNLDGFANVEFCQGSILDEALLKQCTAGCKYVFHQAALGSVPGSVANPVAYHQVNTTGTLNVLEAARHGGVQRVMFAASSSAYGETPQMPKTETIAANPLSPYAANKVACEALMQAYAACYGVDTATLRYFNVFGPRQNANSAYAAVIAAFAKAILHGRAPAIYGDGEQSRDFTFVHNAVHANLLAARCPRPLRGEPLNVAGGTRVTVNELADAMLELLDRTDLSVVHNPERLGDVRHSSADLSRTAQVLDYAPLVDWRTGLAQTVAWYRSEAKAMNNTPTAAILQEVH